jgi:hypothetical protein
MKNTALTILMCMIAACGDGTTTASVKTAAENDQCSEEIARSKAREVSDSIAKANRLDAASGAQMDNLGEDEDYFMITTYYDSGLSVPAYTVKIMRSSCFVTDVTYSNFEG